MTFQPTIKQERIETLDIIRGMALFGIFIVNMQFFNTPKLFVTITGTRLFEGNVSIITNYVIDLFFTGRFFTIFSFLFGLGFFIFMDRLKQKNLSVSRYYTRRLSFLLLLGLVHVVFFWSGDILLPYALAGFFLILFRNKTEMGALKWAIGMFAITYFVIGVLTLLSSLGESLMDMSVASQYKEVMETSFVMYQQGSYMDILSFRITEEIPLILSNLPITIPIVLSVFLFGLYVGKKGIHKNISSHRKWIFNVWKYSFLAGFLLNSLYFLIINQTISMSNILYPAIEQVLGGVTGLVLSFFYVSSITLLCLKSTWLKVLYIFAPVGRMALTNYLMQTLICVIIFNGYGFGLFGTVSPLLGIGYVLIIFAFQIFFSQVWLKYFQYGPLEWVWRQVTYLKKMSLRQAKTENK